MENIQQEVLVVLLRRLLDVGLIDQATYDSAVAMVYASEALPDFFALSAEDYHHGSIQNSRETP